jgi:hypothetical protein
VGWPEIREGGHRIRPHEAGASLQQDGLLDADGVIGAWAVECAFEAHKTGTEKIEGRWGPGGGKLGPLVPAPGLLPISDLTHESFRLALRQVWLVVLLLAFHRNLLLERHRLSRR